ncbi:hypothetical protein PIB30_023280 [Stylosanthes scabra]|uniref:Uncharacterized protein n=1 Tax=Stylosanthes scabra TaxID=79078 RepID=A0ABU6Z8V0_9FABA|nr:hypothetical protein [Stylosanthes scabra]
MVTIGLSSLNNYGILSELKNSKGSGDGNVTGGFEYGSADNWTTRSLDNDNGQDVGSRGAEYAEYAVIKEEKRRSTITTLVNGAATVEGGSTSMMEEGGAASIVSSDSGHRGRRALPFIGKPPILLAAVLPWTRDESPQTLRKEDGASMHC